MNSKELGEAFDMGIVENDYAYFAATIIPPSPDGTIRRVAPVAKSLRFRGFCRAAELSGMPVLAFEDHGRYIETFLILPREQSRFHRTFIKPACHPCRSSHSP